MIVIPARQTSVTGKPQIPQTQQINVLMGVSRVLVALSVRALAASTETVTLLQLRVLVVLTSQGGTNLSTLAETVGVHISNASRTCEALVQMGFVDRRDDPDDRRNVILVARDQGRRVVENVLDRRRELLADLLAQLSAADREAMVGPLERLVEAAAPVPPVDIWSLS